MTYEEAFLVIKSAITDLDNGPIGKALAATKLQAVVNGWPAPGSLNQSQKESDMDNETAKAFADAFVRYLESKTSNATIINIEKAANASIDSLIDSFLGTPVAKTMMAPKK